MADHLSTRSRDRPSSTGAYRLHSGAVAEPELTGVQAMTERNGQADELPIEEQELANRLAEQRPVPALASAGPWVASCPPATQAMVRDLSGCG